MDSLVFLTFLPLEYLIKTDKTDKLKSNYFFFYSLFYWEGGLSILILTNLSYGDSWKHGLRN